MKTRITLIAVLVILVFGVTTVMAQPQQMGKKRMMNDDDFPKLTADQKDKMAQIKVDHQKKMIPLRADLQLKRVEFNEKMRNEAPQSELNSLIDEMGSIKTQMKKIKLDQRLKMHEILTDEQKEFFKSHHGMKGFMDKGERGKDRGGFHKDRDCGQGFRHPFFGDDDFDDNDFDSEYYGLGQRFDNSNNCTPECNNICPRL